ncbi:MAG: Methyltransferase type 11 [Bacteroidota bacterium]|nr:Methyltransferase type 11 [Bacteroidota bacterium]
MIRDWWKKQVYKRRAKQVSDYYDNWSKKFLEITDTFQGFRTENIDETHNHTVKTAGLTDGMKILDAGCGVGGPAFYFATHLKSEIYPLTNSKVQVQIMDDRKKKEALTNIHPTLGDYHEVTTTFYPSFFDAILFLESLGHSYYPEKVIENCYRALKSGGTIYIRDHYRVSGNTEEENTKLDDLTNEANETYVYNHIYLTRLEDALKNAGFRIQMVQRPPLQFFNINPEFEKRFNIKSPNGYFIDTIEIRATKP